MVYEASQSLMLRVPALLKVSKNSVCETQINLIQGYMTTNINITQTWWRLLSAVGSTLITLVAWLGYMALCMVGEVILGIVKFIFGIIISILSMVVLIGTFIWLLTL